ncbi:G-protein coupled receptors family 1 profile domain-containing protein [Caenorhabditis elegans]|uniref:G-protein coupled receptors family 1 profile domain-containing protein n=1 Tax=Caenorhabditis elegans TaxID=6239 RepID=O62300_CAEEL|nr:G-protein coupled receptors family 1 profile domain-containing protein [Caenorhabditis elegans]CAB04560.2 G-protein coupled receptors family 1 profile domain-containing protein [Caenorhabditis elegans]|eukprot:NP_507435.2 Serpentine Receptor, class W [Caenorhabditis elegans]
MDANYVEMFPEFGIESIRVFCAIAYFMGTFNYYSDHVHFVALIVGTVLGVIHLTILTRKCMRALSINVFLIGIAAAEIFRAICILIIFIPFFDLRYLSDEVSDCSDPNSTVAVLSYNISASFMRLAEKVSVWFAVAIAVIRTLVMRYPVNGRINCLTQAKYGFRIVVLITLLIIPFGAPSYFKLNSTSVRGWTPFTNCVTFSENSTKIKFDSHSTELFGSTDVYKIALLIEGIFLEFTPSIILPITTISLIMDLRKARKNSLSTKSSASSSDAVRSIKLVAFVTITFLFTTTPLGFMYIVGIFIVKMPGVIMIVTKFARVLTFLTTLSGIAHILICYLMSTQYRSTAHEMFGKKEKIFKSTSFVHPI